MSCSSASVIRSSVRPGRQALSAPSVLTVQLFALTGWPAVQTATDLKPSCSDWSQHDFAATNLPAGTSPFDVLRGMVLGKYRSARPPTLGIVQAREHQLGAGVRRS